MARPRKLTPLEEYAAYGLRKSGVSYAEIAHNNGASVRTIERIIKRIETDKSLRNRGYKDIAHLFKTPQNAKYEAEFQPLIPLTA